MSKKLIDIVNGQLLHDLVQMRLKHIDGVFSSVFAKCAYTVHERSAHEVKFRTNCMCSRQIYARTNSAIHHDFQFVFIIGLEAIFVKETIDDSPASTCLPPWLETITPSTPN